MSDAAWHPDPLGRYELRWWDGDQWTEHVATGGQQGVDPEPIVVGGVQEQVDDDAGGHEDTAAATSGADGSAGVGTDIRDYDPPRAEDAITVDDDAAGSWPAAEDDGAAAVETGAGQDGTAAEGAVEEAGVEDAAVAGAASGEAAQADAAPDEAASAQEGSAGDGDGVPAADATTGVTAAVDGDAVAPGVGAERQDDDGAPVDEAPPGAAVLAVAPADPAPQRATSGSLGADGIGGGLLDDPAYAEREGERVVLQNPRLLRVSLGRDVMIKRGSMVAYQGQMTFEAESEGGGLGSLVRRAASSDNSKMARASGTGDLFLADAAYEVHLLELDGGGLVVNGPNLLAFEDGMTFRTRSLGNAGIVAGGVFVTDVSGTGWVAVTAHGTPVRLTTDAPTYVDAGAAVAWSSSLQVDLNVQKLGFKSMRSGEIAQLVFRGEGFVLVQASEGGAVPPHNH